MLIGSENYCEIFLDGLKKGINIYSPIAQNTELGWIISGRTAEQANTVSTFHVTTEDKVNIQLRAFWEIEEIPNMKHLTQEEKQCEQIYEKTVKRNKNGSYTVELPFTSDKAAVLGNSRDSAVARLISIEKSFSRHPELKPQYVEFMAEYLKLNHAKPCSTLSINELNQPNQYFLPHQAVIRETSSTTKLRVVFDASSKSKTGYSLNDKLLTGPTIQSDLYSTILKWRKHRFAINADIEKMYRQIQINEKNYNYQSSLENRSK